MILCHSGDSTWVWLKIESCLYLRLYDYQGNNWSWVEKVIIHPLFDKTTADNDIAILKLKTCLCFNNDVKPACLPDSSGLLDYKKIGLISGWGLIKGDIILSLPFQTIGVSEHCS